MVQASTFKRIQAPRNKRYSGKSANTVSWRFLNQKIIALAENHASPKELSQVIAMNEDFSEYLVKQAGCHQDYAISQATIIHAILLLGVDRLCELVAAMS